MSLEMSSNEGFRSPLPSPPAPKRKRQESGAASSTRKSDSFTENQKKSPLPSPPPKRKRQESGASSTSTRKSKRISSSSYDTMEENQNRYLDVVTAADRNEKRILPTDIVCLYERKDEVFKSHTELPLYMKKGAPKAKVLKCCEIVEQPGMFLSLDPQSLNKLGRRRMKIISACNEIMLKDLYFTENARKWEDASSSYEKFKKSVKAENAIEQKKEHDVSNSLFSFRGTMLDGFKNGRARNGLNWIVRNSMYIIQKADEFEIENIGGGSQSFDGNAETACLYHPMEYDEKERLNTAKVVLSMDKAVRKCYVPDIVTSTKAGRDFFLFGECKPMEANYTNFDQMISQVWHQALRGLFSNGISYGLAFNGCVAILLKLEIKNDQVETAKRLFYLYEMKYSAGKVYYQFNLERFLDLLMVLSKIFQDKLK